MGHLLKPSSFCSVNLLVALTAGSQGSSYRLWTGFCTQILSQIQCREGQPGHWYRQLRPQQWLWGHSGLFNIFSGWSGLGSFKSLSVFKWLASANCCFLSSTPVNPTTQCQQIIAQPSRDSNWRWRGRCTGFHHNVTEVSRLLQYRGNRASRKWMPYSFYPMCKILKATRSELPRSISEIHSFLRYIPIMASIFQ